MAIKGCKTLSVNPKSPDPEMIGKAASLIKNGGLVIFPTSSFYGLGAEAFHADAIDKVFRVKKRDPQKPVLILVASPADLAPLVRSIPKIATRLMEALWPGSMTLVFHAAEALPSNLTGHTGKIGIRLTSHPVASALVRAAGYPITGTSANLSGTGGRTTVADIDPQIRDQVDLVLDAGKTMGGKGSTVVDVTVNPLKILREGVISAERIKEISDQFPVL
ncbi:MAG: threonylcarbamoyl-AMP synthase [Deltaproteobacteria bacterium]|nr:threonylcarbamoyl-AMP synthase [Deltaproteobacteria bacterium]MBW2074805.1 threonylcarbamoyl-AMP synthase [Deltaproteobacteria bacterium]RLB80313.1 MAG: threonylcarbamoyl-AMP synthase [Deltaproteobacteria bacterium]